MVELKPLTLGSLFAKLRDSLVQLTRDLDRYINNAEKIMSIEEINKLRDHIQEKLNRNEEIEDNKKLKELLDLFVNDREVINFIRKDAASWIAMLDSIIDNLSKRKEPLSEEERMELEELVGMANQIKNLLRRAPEKNIDHKSNS
ncbi:MAG: hypothetical protein ACPLYE_03035 [Candidatus Micrarchaeales archaeon]|jgi:hypothetical protein